MVLLTVILLVKLLSTVVLADFYFIFAALQFRGSPLDKNPQGFSRNLSEIPRNIVVLKYVSTMRKANSAVKYLGTRSKLLPSKAPRDKIMPPLATAVDTHPTRPYLTLFSYWRFSDWLYCRYVLYTSKQVRR